MTEQTADTFDLRRARLERGFSTRRLAQQLGISGGTIRRIERHEGMVRPDIAKAVADFFGVGVFDVAPQLDDEAA